MREDSWFEGGFGALARATGHEFGHLNMEEKMAPRGTLYREQSVVLDNLVAQHLTAVRFGSPWDRGDNGRLSGPVFDSDPR